MRRPGRSAQFFGTNHCIVGHVLKGRRDGALSNAISNTENICECYDQAVTVCLGCAEGQTDR